MAEITPSTLDKNPGTSTTIHTGSENRLNGKHISSLQEGLQCPNTPKRKFKRNTERMSFVIACTAWKALYQEKENEKKEKDLAKLVRKKEREEKNELKKDTADKCSIEETSDTRRTDFSCTKGVKLTGLACSLCNRLVHRKCHHKMHIPEKVMIHMLAECFLYADSFSDVALDDSE
jgi:hypothetical protein